MKKRLPIIGLLALLAAAVILVLALNRPQQPVQYGVELVKNGGFEQVTGEGYPEHWLPEAYISTYEVSEYTMTEGLEGQGIKIVNHQPNDARFYQTVRVHPNTTYRFSGFVKAAAQDGRGANLSIGGIYVFSETVLDTQGDWQPLTIYGRTGSKQTELTLFARLGGYSGEATGEASFDQLSLMAVEKAPEGVPVPSWDKPEPFKDAQQPAQAGSFALPLLAIYTVFAFALYVLARAAQQAAHQTLVKQDNRLAYVYLAVLLAFAFLTRLWLARAVAGFPVDVSAFRAWSNDMARVGPGGFYLQPGHRDYPPGYMLLLWPLGLIGNHLSGGTSAMLVKLPSLLSDLLVIALLFFVAKKKVSPLSALLLASLYAFNPLGYLAGAAWGQVDSLPAFLLMLSVLLIIKNRWRYALPVYVLAVLMKPQALMVGPLGLLALVMDLAWHWQRKPLKDVLIGVAASLVVAAAIVLPFFNQQNGLAWLVGLYGNTMSYYHYATVNATNLYFAFGQNWVSIEHSAPHLLRVCGILTLLVPIGLMFFKKIHQRPLKLDRGTSLDLGLYGLAALLALIPLLPMSLQATGTLLMIAVFVMVAHMFIKGKSLANLPLLAGILLTGFSVLGTMMHERYLFLAVALFTLAYVQKRDRRILLLLLFVSALCFLNTGLALDRGMRIGGTDGNLDAPMAGLVSDSAWLEYTLSFFSLFLTSVSLYIGYVLCRRQEAIQPLKSWADQKALQPKARFAFVKARKLTRFDRKDALSILAVTLLYAVVALVNLGAAQSPTSAWVSSDQEQQAVLDLGEERSFQLLFFAGIHWSKSEFEVEYSTDGVNYSSYPFQVEQGDLYNWRYLGHPYQDKDGNTKYDSIPRQLTGRYVRLSGITNRLTLLEIVAQDFITGQNLPFVSASEGAQALIDEQGIFSGRPSWHNSMYFDEIYHARTALEQLNGLTGQQPSQIYETTHPPLGKLMMTFSIMIFGMNPFGWRFAGALAGILMLPGLYLLGKQLTGRRSLGLFAMLMMAFDFMHFTQTRIATIDSFVTLFIIYAYFFMFRYMMQDALRTPFKNRLLMLFLSGLMMGLSVASKWPGIYAGIGLAVLFFWSLIKDMLHGYTLQQADPEELACLQPEEAALAGQYSKDWLRLALLTCLWCLLFFVAIPALIYYLSFYPVFVATPGGLSIQKVVKANLGMYDYHSTPGLGADHAWSSPWHSWPVVGKPMYFYSGGQREGTSSVIWSFGNPLVWWGGLAALVVTSMMAFFKRSKQPALIASKTQDAGYDPRPLMLLLSFLAQYLPWVLVPRGTYIYHYFPSVPFIILCMALLLSYLYDWKPKLARVSLIVLCVLAGGLFVAFFPYISGVRVSVSWLEALRFLPNWLWY